eukprot:1565830-Pleurochrysis_carterae.AAC.2
MSTSMLNHVVEARQPHIVAKHVCSDGPVNKSGSQEEVGRICAEKRSIGELDEYCGPPLTCVKAVVQMRCAENDRCHRNIRPVRQACGKEKGAHACAKYPLLGNRTHKQAADVDELLKLPCSIGSGCHLLRF